MSEPIELVIFDCDGVLVDSERIAVRIMATVFERIGRPMAEPEIIERYVGQSAMYAADIRAYARNGSQRSWEEESELLYRDALVRELTPIDGVVEALDAITIPTCVASNGSHEKMRFTLGLYRPVRAVRGADLQRERRRPGQAGAGSLPPRRGADGRCAGRGVVVEDSASGVRAARAAGMRVFG